MKSPIIYLPGLIIAFFLFNGIMAQSEERPQWAPRSEKHRNVRDEFGRKQGLWKYYSFNRILIQEITYVNDIKHGPYTRHNSATGIVVEESNYFNGKRDGDYKKYSANGTLITEGQYSMGRRVGQWVTYYPVNGEKRSEGAYNNGKREGIWHYYSSKGKLITEGEYKNGLREGTWTYYSEDGTKIAEKKYQNGKEVGVISTQPVTIKKKPKTRTTTQQGTQPGIQIQGTETPQPGNQGNP